MALELKDIHKHFGPVRANDGITLTVEEGTLHGVRRISQRNVT